MIAGNRTAGHTLIQRRRWLAPPTGHGRSKVLMDAIADPDPRVGLLQAQTRNMRSKCRCSCVLQFTLCHAFSSVLHRPPSQLIHCIVLYSILYAFTRKRFPRIQRLCSRGEKGSKVGTRPGHRAAAHRHPPGLASRGTDHRLAAPQQTGCRPASSRTRRGPGIPGGGYQSLKTAKPWPLMILPQVHLRKPCYDFYFL